MKHDPGFQVRADGDREIVVERTFAAPPQAVWEAMTHQGLLQRWLLGPPGWTMPVCEVDVRVGGAFRHVWRNADGAEMAMSGEFLEVDPPRRLVRTETFSMGCDAQAGTQTATLVLLPHPGGTRLRTTVAFPSTAARDAALQSGMEHGMAASYDRVDRLLPERS